MREIQNKREMNRLPVEFESEKKKNLKTEIVALVENKQYFQQNL